MKCHFRKNLFRLLTCRRGFSLVEATTALLILAFICTSVLIVINRCMTSAANSALRMQAFEIARENMEKLLSSESVQEIVEYGNSERYPDVQWQITVETFYEPLTSQMWLQAVCSSEYTDSSGEAQEIELTHWLGGLTKAQEKKIKEEKRKEREWLAEQRLTEAQDMGEEDSSQKPDERGEQDKPAGQDSQEILPGLGPNPTWDELMKWIKENM